MFSFNTLLCHTVLREVHYAIFSSPLLVLPSSVHISSSAPYYRTSSVIFSSLILRDKFHVHIKYNEKLIFYAFILILRLQPGRRQFGMDVCRHPSYLECSSFLHTCIFLIFYFLFKIFKFCHSLKELVICPYVFI
jgi:hypothetical protein